MKSVKVNLYLGMGDAKKAALNRLGIEYTAKYIHDNVPCQCKTELTIEPKNEMEFFAVLGIFS